MILGGQTNTIQMSGIESSNASAIVAGTGNTVNGSNYSVILDSLIDINYTGRLIVHHFYPKMVPIKPKNT